MTALLGAALGDATTGNEAGWALTFHTEADGRVVPEPVLTVSIQSYYADIQASLPSGIDGGTSTFAIEGMTDDDYAKIAQTSAGKPTVVKLYLFWRDTNSSPVGYLANVAGLTDLLGEMSHEALQPALVSVLAIRSVSRKLGERRYETIVQAKELAFIRLRERRLVDGLAADKLSAAAQDACKRAGVAVELAGFGADGSLPGGGATSPATEKITKDPGVTCLQVMTELAASVEQATSQYGRGMVLIRDGAVRFGPRPIPPMGTRPKELTFRNGLIETEAVADATSDPNFDPTDPANVDALAARRQFKLVLKGRPDLKPGDLVRFDVPPTEIASTVPDLLTAVAGSFLPGAGDSMQNPATLYIGSVEHRLGRTSGFSTTVTGVVVDESDPWDHHSPGGSHVPRADSAPNGASASPAVDAAKAIRRLASGAADAVRSAEIAEAREWHPEAAGDIPSQTVDVYRGLESPDGLPSQARRLPVRRKQPARVNGVATATAFAWGKCGLVVPRYPGTRLVLVHRNGHGDDPVEIGAIWESGRGPDSKPGDWWLTLPVGFTGDKRSIPDGQDPTDHTGQVSNDLVDADGSRVIQVAGLTISVGKNSLPNAGERPAPPSGSDVVTIENADKAAKITIDDQGAITIHAAKDLVLEAPSGDIKLSATNVDVTVSGAMNVHG